MIAFEKSSPHFTFLAVAKAVKFAMDPPLVKMPPPFFTGKLKSFNNQFRVLISIPAAAGEPTHPPAKILNPVANASDITLI